MGAVLRIHPSILVDPDVELKKARGFFEKVIRKVSKLHSTANSVVFAINDMFRPLISLMKIPKPGVAMTMGFSAFSCADIFFAGPRFVFAVKDLFTAKTAYGRIYSLFRSVAELATIAAEGVWIIEGLKKVEVIARSALPWTSVVSTVLLPFQFICLPFSVYQVYKVNGLRREIQKHFKSPHRYQTLEGRAENITKALHYVVKEHVSIRETLSISKKAEMKFRAETFLQQMHSLDGEEKEKKMQEAERFMQTLKTRARARTVLDVGATITQVAILALSIAALCSPGAEAVPILLIVAAGVSFAFTVFDWTLFDKNPFKEKSNNWFNKSVQVYRNSVFTGSSYIYKGIKFVTIKPVKFVLRQIAHLAKKAFTAVIESRPVQNGFEKLVPYVIKGSEMLDEMKTQVSKIPHVTKRAFTAAVENKRIKEQLEKMRLHVAKGSEVFHRMQAQVSNTLVSSTVG